jgi:hypothetical protein
MYSTLLCECLSITDSIQISGFTWVKHTITYNSKTRQAVFVYITMNCSIGMSAFMLSVFTIVGFYCIHSPHTKWNEFHEMNEKRAFRQDLLTCVFKRYDISSNSPSGGMNEIVLSLSNLDNLTHWWNLTSSSSTALLFPPVRKHNKCMMKKMSGNRPMCMVAMWLMQSSFCKLQDSIPVITAFTIVNSILDVYSLVYLFS